jgi:hypothetical protein
MRRRVRTLEVTMSKTPEAADRGSRPSPGCALDAAILNRLGQTLRQLYEPLLHETPNARIASLLQALEDRDGGTDVGWPAMRMPLQGPRRFAQPACRV